jgi:hypothetical protein
MPSLRLWGTGFTSLVEAGLAQTDAVGAFSYCSGAHALKDLLTT